MKTVEEYWAKIRRPFPAQVFDFISIHKYGNVFNLVSLLCICGEGTRPEFEKMKYYSHSAAKMAAKSFRRNYGLNTNIVDCTEREA